MQLFIIISNAVYIKGLIKIKEYIVKDKLVEIQGCKAIEFKMRIAESLITVLNMLFL